jgi:alpha-methylacyl-CoA racemase
VVDANVLDATATLMAMTHGLRATGQWSAERGANLLDSGCPYYDVYTCSDGRWVAVGTIESRFYQTLLDVLGLAGDDRLREAHRDRTLWPALRDTLTRVFTTRPRDEWAAAFRGVDACVTPVLDLDEAVLHEQARARDAYAPVDGGPGVQPVVSPRFSRSGTPVPGPAPEAGHDGDAVLAELGYAAERIAGLRAAGVVG